MSYFASGQDLEGELIATLERFLASGEHHGPSLLLRTRDPDAVVAVDFGSDQVGAADTDRADVVLELDAEALHDILLNRLDPVQISRLYETGRVAFTGSAEHLAALILLAGRLQPHYEASLRERGRADLLGTPAPPTKVTWGDPAEPLRPLLHNRRPWQRPKRTAPAAG